MAKITPKEWKWLLILWFVFCTSTILSILLQIATLLLVSFIVLGIIITAAYFAYNKQDWNGKPELISIISVLLAVIALFLAGYEKPVLKSLTHLFYEKNTVNFNKDIIKNRGIQPHKFIFVFDNSGGYLDDIRRPTANDYDKYKDYCEYINEIQTINIKEEKEFTYADMLKSRLCYDLINTMKHNGKENNFIIVKIGSSDIINEFSHANNWLTVNKENVKQNIKRLFTLQPENKVSNFFDLYTRIQSHCNNHKVSVFIYSDFVHDLTENTTTPNKQDSILLDNNVSDIKKIQNELTEEQVIQNLFFVSISIIKKDERGVLPEENATFIKRFDISSVNIQTPIPHKIEETKNLPFLYFKNIFATTASLEIDFLDTVMHIIDIDNQFTIYRNAKESKENKYKYQENNPFNDKKALIIYDKDLPPQPMPKLQIIQNGKYYISTCNFEKRNAAIGRIGWLLPCIVLGCVFGYIINLLKNK